ncbi:LysR family transcriptional regulator [Tropicimonas sp. IMCC6043]|uniref:LysR family transcriptional regulator n=1 Tax=Tropicimonas sp. IMCC6043 TaxID=2510645 RepID=UPI00101BD06A|nr:LysR family transcriptional regulator [Tropicimonas sp. IMCC6043]RYH12253.1 LysR family transcriptional regulator [Tropicimonas sp. IMCC6043]
MKLAQLRYFLLAARAGSISAGARMANMAQPAFSLQIKVLEEDLGVPVFERGARGVRLTPAGERLFDRATALLRHVDQVREEVVNATDEPVGEVRIVLAASLAPRLAGRIFWETRRAFPKVNLHILDLYRGEMDDQMAPRYVDFALRPNVTAMSGITSEPVIAQKLYLVGSELPASLGETIEFAELRHFPLVMGHKTHQLRIEMENIALREGLSLNIAYEQDSISVYRSIIQSGPACTIVPYSAFSAEIEAGWLSAARIESPFIERVLSFAWHADTGLSSSALAVKDLLHRCIRDMVEEGTFRGRLL